MGQNSMKLEQLTLLMTQGEGRPTMTMVLGMREYPMPLTSNNN